MEESLKENGTSMTLIALIICMLYVAFVDYNLDHHFGISLDKLTF
jgi:hypothetical protein